MKCPNCNIIISNTKDSCPSCNIDLREIKLALGFEISKDVAKEQKQISTKAEEPKQSEPSIKQSQPIKHISNRITPSSKKEILSPTEKQSSSHNEKDLKELFLALKTLEGQKNHKKVSTIPSQSPKHDLLIKEQPKPKIIEFSDNDQTFEKQIDAILNKLESCETTLEETVLDSAQSSQSEVLTKIKYIISHNRLPSPSRPEGRTILELLALFSDVCKLNQAELVKHYNLAFSQINVPYIKTEAAFQKKSTIEASDALWDLLKEELIKTEALNSKLKEINPHDLADFSLNEKTELLFELCEEELTASHNKNRQQLSSAPASSERVLNNKSITSAIVTFEHEQNEVEKKEKRFFAYHMEHCPSLLRRFCSAIVDAIIVLALSSVFYFSTLLSPVHRQIFLKAKFPPFYQIANEIPLFILICYITWVGINSLLLAKSGRTIGLRLCNLFTVNTEMQELSLTQAFVRTICQTLSIWTFGLSILSLFIGKKSFIHDMVSRTTVIVYHLDSSYGHF